MFSFAQNFCLSRFRYITNLTSLTLWRSKLVSDPNYLPEYQDVDENEKDIFFEEDLE